MQDLSRKGIIQSFKGPHGGFYLDESSLSRPLSDIVEAVDGNSLFNGCGLGLKACSEINPCPLHSQFKEIRNSIYKMLKDTTIGTFNDELLTGIFSLKK